MNFDECVLHLVLIYKQFVLLQLEDYDTCYSLCCRLTELGLPDGWEVCAELAKHPSYEPLQHKARLLDYALTHCPPQYIDDLVRHRYGAGRTGVPLLVGVRHRLAQEGRRTLACWWAPPV